MTDDDSLKELEILANGRARAETAAEKLLLKKVKTGDIAPISNRNPTFFVPWLWTNADTIRAEFLRHLCLNPEMYEIDPRGILLWGARIEGELNLIAATLKRPLWITASHFTAKPTLRDATTRSLSLQLCHMRGFSGDRLTVRGTLRFDASTFEGEVCLAGADISSDLSFTGASFNNPNGFALFGDGLKTGGSMFFRGLTAQGETRLPGTKIDNNLECDGATFANSSGEAFNGQRMIVGGRLFWRNLAKPPQGSVVFDHATAGDFFRDSTGDPATGHVQLDGFHYQHLGIAAKADAHMSWLAHMPPHDRIGGPAFWPQPYEQLIKVLHEAGHERDARFIAIAKQDALCDHLKRQATYDGVTTWHRRLGMLFLKVTAGYGYRPSNALWISCLIMLIGAVVFDNAYTAKKMLPAKELAFIHKCYTPTQNSDENNTKECTDYWHDVSLESYFLMSFPTADNPIYPRQRPWQTMRVPNDYVTFSTIAYSIDVFVPILDLQQETSWMPKEGWFRFYLWVHIVLGWIFTTITVAGFSGFLKKNDK